MTRTAKKTALANDMEERIQKIIAACGLCSRRKAEALILEGRVTVNGVTAKLGDTAELCRDELSVDGRPLTAQEEKKTLLLYKPRGYVTTAADEKGRKTVMELVPPSPRLYPVGRLDLNSEGLLLMTNDGELARRLTHPSHEMKKVYHVWVTSWQNRALSLLSRPIVLDGHQIQPPSIRLFYAENGIAKLQITIHEGRNRQIRRMCEQAGLFVTRLKRVAEAGLTLGDLKPGEYRELSSEEIQSIK